ncbi:hypothetical protein HanRHA438_Chr11g0515071 [Helianthus annuus]|nr:hypothetical protein HanRHA438_Chr11g0515071 [Helianthus annuus]
MNGRHETVHIQNTLFITCTSNRICEVRMSNNLLGIREVVVDLLVEYVEDDIQKVPSNKQELYLSTILSLIESYLNALTVFNGDFRAIYDYGDSQ